MPTSVSRITLLFIPFTINKNLWGINFRLCRYPAPHQPFILRLLYPLMNTSVAKLVVFQPHCLHGDTGSLIHLVVYLVYTISIFVCCYLSLWNGYVNIYLTCSPIIGYLGCFLFFSVNAVIVHNFLHRTLSLLKLNLQEEYCLIRGSLLFKKLGLTLKQQILPTNQTKPTPPPLPPEPQMISAIECLHSTLSGSKIRRI